MIKNTKFLEWHNRREGKSFYPTEGTFLRIGLLIDNGKKFPSGFFFSTNSEYYIIRRSPINGSWFYGFTSCAKKEIILDTTYYDDDSKRFFKYEKVFI